MDVKAPDLDRRSAVGLVTRSALVLTAARLLVLPAQI